jgi:hypothetical protein
VRAAYLDNADFEHTDIPYDFPIPTEAAVGRREHDEAHGWVLGVSVSQDQTFDQVRRHLLHLPFVSACFP